MKDDLLDYLNNNARNGSAKSIEAGDNLLLSGILDSIGLMQMIGFIEDRSGLEIPNEDIVIANFGSVDAIDAYLRRLRERRQAADPSP